MGEIFLVFLFSLLPSLIWLLFYLKRDPNPEPKRKVLLVFLSGFFLVWVAFFFEGLLFFANLGLIVSTFLFAFFEEFLKFLPFKIFIEKSKEYEEPVDAMIYLITSAMGFSFGENIIGFWYSLDFSIKSLFFISFSRFLSSTLLHAQSSGFFGFFLGLGFLAQNHSKKAKMTLLGLALATFYHGMYNLLIDKISNFYIKILIVYSLLVVFIAFLLSCFKRLKKLKK